jgi:hypothetical protein
MAQQPVKLNLKIYQGSTFRETLRWETAEKGYATITAITKTAPMVVTATSHGIPAGWRAKIVGVQGMKEANTADYIVATQVVGDQITFNSINATGFTTYTSGGVLEFNKPADLTGYTARMQIREKITSDVVLYELTTQNAGIVIDNVLKTIVLTIPAATTAGFNFQTAVYSLELVNGLEVIPFAGGSVSLIKEVTR